MISFCPKNAIANSMRASPRVYDMRAKNQNANQAGRTIASIRAYVGLQELNTGPSANHINMYLEIHFFSLLLWSNSLDFPENPNLVEIVFHKFGNIVMIPKAIKTQPENDFQNDGGTSIKIVLALSKIENKSIDILKDPIIISGIFLLLLSSALAHNTIGSSGKTQGARTVKIQDKKAITKSVIYKFYK